MGSLISALLYIQVIFIINNTLLLHTQSIIRIFINIRVYLNASVYIMVFGRNITSHGMYVIRAKTIIDAIKNGILALAKVLIGTLRT